jgi:hypothetical protein
MIDRSRLAAGLLGLALLFAAATDYIPAFIDAEGRVFGLFQLDIYKDAPPRRGRSRRRLFRGRRRSSSCACSERSISLTA